MANKLYKFEIDAGTVNKISTLLLPLDPHKGKGFRIEKMWISVRDLDAIAAADQIGIQFATVDGKGGDPTDFEQIDSQYEIFTKLFDFHLAEAALTNLIDPQIEMEIDGIEGTFLDCSDKNYAAAVITGQDGELPMQVKILGGYVNKMPDDFKFNTF